MQFLTGSSRSFQSDVAERPPVQPRCPVFNGRHGASVDLPGRVVRALAANRAIQRNRPPHGLLPPTERSKFWKGRAIPTSKGFERSVSARKPRTRTAPLGIFRFHAHDTSMNARNSKVPREPKPHILPTLRASNEVSERLRFQNQRSLGAASGPLRRQLIPPPRRRLRLDQMYRESRHGQAP